ncbi:MAG: hypothetical protein PHS80_15170 [Methanothrix sp.]|nr:hypothetical protein [Methanothrix sp.]MDD4447268.1 hypothetical protein [Methanothrix sp.]
MKRQMIIIFILTAALAQATVEDSGMAPGEVSTDLRTGFTSTSLPTFLPSPCSGDFGDLTVSIGITGPESEPDKSYTTPGKPLDFMVTINNDGNTLVEAQVSVNPKVCPFEWFSWTSTPVTIPAGASRYLSLQISPDTNAVAGEYNFAVEASAKCRSSGQRDAKFKVQSFDYASETSVSGSGQFQIDKDLRSMNSGIKSTKSVLFSGSVDALVKNEYLVDKALGKNANFQEQDAVDNYNAVSLGDSLVGTESFKSSAVFGGVGAKVRESYDVSQMEFKDQDFTLHQTGSLKKTAEFKTADNFTGYYLIDAKQVVPGQKNLKEFEEYFGSFEINRRILFRDAAKSSSPCRDGDCLKAPTINAPAISSPSFTSPCMSSSCSDFVDRLNSFGK